MFILSGAVASPNTFLSDAALSALGSSFGESSTDLARRAGVKQRAVSLPLEIIQGVSNLDVREKWKVATASPTTLGAQAVELALSQAGVSIEEVGLVLADTATPYQTCPSEAQRLVGSLGVKIPAFDLIGGFGAIAQMIKTLSTWSEQRVPEYVLCISTNTPSQQVNYQADIPTASVLGDAAVAFLIAPRRASGLMVSSTQMRSEDKRRIPFMVDRNISLDATQLISKDELKKLLVSELIASGVEQSTSLVVPPQLYARESIEILEELGVARERIFSGVDDIGFAFGSSPGIGLIKARGAVRPGQQIVMLHGGDGLCGSVVLTAI